jgi:HNH endonuclease
MVLLTNGSPLGQSSSFCFYCGRPLRKVAFAPHTIPPRDAATRDHLIPKRLRGKKDCPTVSACLVCNKEKNDLTVSEYRLLRAFRAGLVPLPEYKFAAEERA